MTPSERFTAHMLERMREFFEAQQAATRDDETDAAAENEQPNR